MFDEAQSVFISQLSWKRMPKETGENFMALTGPLPDLKYWSANVPSPLSTGVMDWRPCEIVSRIWFLPLHSKCKNMICKERSETIENISN